VNLSQHAGDATGLICPVKINAPGPAARLALLTTTSSRCILLIVLDLPRRDRVAERREATRAEILQVAWELAQEQGLAEFTLRDLAERVGMRAPSLYTHFESKHAIYDAMFGQAWSDYEQVALAELANLPQAPRAAIRREARVFFDFAVANPARHQLMNQRTIPGFEPSAESYAPAVRVLELGKQIFHSIGLSDPADFDISTAIIDGMINQQLANDPGGTRWSALLDRAVDIWADGVGLPPDPLTQNRRATQPRRPHRRTPATKRT
jgi:AcrR family transcriptional regulator